MSPQCDDNHPIRDHERWFKRFITAALYNLNKAGTLIDQFLIWWKRIDSFLHLLEQYTGMSREEVLDQIIR